MLSYQHAYHAGNFADVVKHTLLTLILERLNQKPKGFSYYDTHAGRGIYSTRSAEMTKKPEYLDGLARVWAVRDKAPTVLKPYLDVIRRLNPSGELTTVPGSPTLARYLTRETDNLHLCELHPAEHEALQRALGGDKRVHIHRADGFTCIPSLLPPATSRGVVIIDPSYELSGDYARVVDVVGGIFDRWPQACVLVWYPLLSDSRHVPLVRGLADLGIASTWLAELTPTPHAHGMLGTGQIILGLPWQLDTHLTDAIHWLGAILGDDKADVHCAMLVEPA